MSVKNNRTFLLEKLRGINYLAKSYPTFYNPLKSQAKRRKEYG
jgi:hypothetical protein